MIKAPLLGISILALYSVPGMLLKAYLMLIGMGQRGTSRDRMERIRKLEGLDIQRVLGKREAKSTD